jgi:hypothetical protein
MATGSRGSGFISADNSDDTAANFFRLRDQASLPRDRLVAWNVVPWYQPDGERTANATRHMSSARCSGSPGSSSCSPSCSS